MTPIKVLVVADELSADDRSLCERRESPAARPVNNAMRLLLERKSSAVD
jgi:hypothetical protein